MSTPFIVRQNSVNHDKTAYIVNLSCGAMTNSSTLRSCRASAFLGRVRTDIFLYTETMLNKDENRIFTKVLQMPNYQGQAAMEDLTAAPAKETEKQCGIRYIYLQSENSFF